MKKIFISGFLMIVILIVLAGADIYQEPWIQNQLGDQHNLTDMGWISANYFNGTNQILNWSNITHLYNTNFHGINLESNLDGTGFNITVSTLFSTWINGFISLGNILLGDNNITGVNEISTTLVDTTNLEAENLESNLDGTGYNITGDKFYAGDGTAGSPSITFTSDPNTGFYSYSADNIGFASGGSAKFVFAGNIIRSADAAGVYMTKAAGTADAPVYSFYTDTNTGMWRSSADELSFGAGGTEGLRIDYNELEVQPMMTLATGPIDLEEDSGAVTIMNLPVSSTPSDGDEESYTFAIDSNNVLKIYGEADGAGGSDTHKVFITGDLNVTGNVNGTMFYENAISLIDKYYQKSNPFSFYNSTDFNISDYLLLSGGTMTGNLNTQKYLNITSSDYGACSASYEGFIVYNSTSKHFYGCNSTSWNQLDN